MLLLFCIAIHNQLHGSDLDLLPKLSLWAGRAVAQALSRWLPTAAARVRFRAACGVYGAQSGTGAGFPQVLQFPLPIIPPISPSS
jgi:hypothetical protein